MVEFGNIKRVKNAFEGVPPETRKALEDGTTEFLRELHGGARLYPDTDSKAIINKSSEIEEIKNILPRYPWEVIKEYSKKYNTEERMIKELIFDGNLALFEKLIKIYPENPTIIFTTLLETTTALRRDGKDIAIISDQDYMELFQELKYKNIGKEAIEEIMATKADFPDLSIKQIKEKLDIESISTEELEKIIRKILEKNIHIIKEREIRALGPLMGEIMKEVRGKIDGAIVSKELKNQLEKKLKELK